MFVVSQRFMVFDESVPFFLRDFRSHLLEPLDLTSYNKLVVHLEGGFPHTFQFSKFKQFDVLDACYDLPFKGCDCCVESICSEVIFFLIKVCEFTQSFQKVWVVVVYFMLVIIELTSRPPCIWVVHFQSRHDVFTIEHVPYPFGDRGS